MLHAQTLADSAGIPGIYKAWFATSASDDAESQFVQHAADHQLVDGTVITNGWADPTDGTLDNPINKDENGNAPGSTNVWTGTNDDGTSNGTDCTDWTVSASGNGIAARDDSTTSFWTNWTSAACGFSDHLYCRVVG